MELPFFLVWNFFQLVTTATTMTIEISKSKSGGIESLIANCIIHLLPQHPANLPAGIRAPCKSLPK